jgi:type 1 glutamine amidotransferase
VKNLLLTGGPLHPFETTARTVADLLAEDGIDSVVTDGIEDGLQTIGEYDLLTVYLLRWRMLGAMFDDDRDAWAMSLSDAGRDAILGHLQKGRPLLALHTAAVSFDDWPEWADVIGARWDWERSSHPPPRPSMVHVASAHPIVAGIDDFEVVDEIYSFLDLRDVTPLLTSPRRGEAQPLLWTRTHGDARVAYDALGHDDLSLTHPSHATIIRRAATWVTGRLP